MDNLLRQIDVNEDIFIDLDSSYKTIGKEDYIEQFGRLRSKGNILSEFEDSCWKCSHPTGFNFVDFSLDEVAYKRHLGETLEYTASEIVDVMKCFTLYITGEFVFNNIRDEVDAVRSFLTRFNGSRYQVVCADKVAIINFLGFIGLSALEIDRYDRMISVKDANRSHGQRELAPLITYLALSAEIDDIYADPNLPRDEFIRWFPVYFWSHITFILPLRPTEMLLTPFDCLELVEKENGITEVYLTVRRTLLKKGTRTVYYDVDLDYKKFRFKIYEYTNEAPETVRIIREYQEMTRDLDRKYLFAFGKAHRHQMFSLVSFNYLLREFTISRLIGNPKYDFARDASEIGEFEVPTAGDSRPIAMANIFYQVDSPDVCRQLADHESMEMSAHYYSNVAKTIEMASIMQMQQVLNCGDEYRETVEKKYKGKLAVGTEMACTAPRQPKITGDITDCIEQDRIGSDCIGCRYYLPNAEKLKADLDDCRKDLESASKAAIESVISKKNTGVDIDKLFLDVQTSSARYKVSCDLQAEEKAKSWQRRRNTQTTSC